jgi:hypothetical protein
LAGKFLEAPDGSFASVVDHHKQTLPIAPLLASVVENCGLTQIAGEY